LMLGDSVRLSGDSAQPEPTVTCAPSRRLDTSARGGPIAAYVGANGVDSLRASLAGQVANSPFVPPAIDILDAAGDSSLLACEEQVFYRAIGTGPHAPVDTTAAKRLVRVLGGQTATLRARAYLQRGRAMSQRTFIVRLQWVSYPNRRLRDSIPVTYHKLNAVGHFARLDYRYVPAIAVGLVGGIFLVAATK
jgi:hypothetical protein